MRERILNVLFALDCFLFALFTLGGSFPSESFSSAAWRSENMGGWYGRIFRPVIDWVARKLGQVDHCKSAYYRAKLNLPPDER
jgi:hypothetical protein